ncbi:unnamed protein product [Camellia sinensis]
MPISDRPSLSLSLTVATASNTPMVEALGDALTSLSWEKYDLLNLSNVSFNSVALVMVVLEGYPEKDMSGFLLQSIKKVLSFGGDEVETSVIMVHPFV